MSWFDDEINAGDSYQEVADPWAAPSGNGSYAPSVRDSYSQFIDDSAGVFGPPTEAEFQESLRDVAFAGYEVPAWTGITAPGSGPAKSQGASEPAKPKDQESKGLIGRITDFANNNKSLTEMLLKGLAGAASAKQSQKAAMAQMQEKDRLERERNAQYSASIADLAKPTGLMGRAQPLRRVGGGQVFNNGRIA